MLQKYILNSSIKMPIVFNVLIGGINNSLLEITCALINNLFTIYLHMIILQSQGIILLYICIYFLLKLTYKSIFFNFILYYTFILLYYVCIVNRFFCFFILNISTLHSFPINTKFVNQIRNIVPLHVVYSFYLFYSPAQCSLVLITFVF